MLQVNDRMSEPSTHGNLGVAYQALGMHEMALLHYHSHLNIARELKVPLAYNRQVAATVASSQALSAHRDAQMGDAFPHA